jgi:hypothetical protein
VSRRIGALVDDHVAWLSLASEVDMYCTFFVPRRNSVVGPSDSNLSAGLA